MSDKDRDLSPSRVIGIKYDPEQGLPKVILKGAGKLAKDIIEKGKGNKGRPYIVENDELATQLYKLPVDSEIRPELFELVATVFVHLYAVEEKIKEEGNGRS